MRGEAWIATEGRGHRLVPNTSAIQNRALQLFTQYDTSDGLPSNVIRRTAVAPSGDIWFATAAGATRLRNRGGAEVVTTFNTLVDAPSNEMRDVAVDVVQVNGSNREIAWIATAGGLARIDALVPSTIAITTTDALPSNNLRTVSLDSSHAKYLGTTAGIVIYGAL